MLMHSPNHGILRLPNDDNDDDNDDDDDDHGDDDDDDYVDMDTVKRNITLSNIDHNTWYKTAHDRTTRRAMTSGHGKVIVESWGWIYCQL